MSSVKEQCLPECASKAGVGGQEERVRTHSGIGFWGRELWASPSSCLSPAGFVVKCSLGGRAADTPFLVLLTPPSCPRVPAQLSVRGRAAGLALCWEGWGIRVLFMLRTAAQLISGSLFLVTASPSRGVSSWAWAAPDQVTCRASPVTTGCTGCYLLSPWVCW